MAEVLRCIKPRTQSEEAIIERALGLLIGRLKNSQYFTSANDAQDYLRLKLAPSHRELFAILFLDTGHRLIEDEVMFMGTIASCSVHPREIMLRALSLNASAIILGHNHPSGSLSFSSEDKRLTQRIFDAGHLLDIRVLDHILVSSDGSASMANLGIMPEATPT